MTGIFYVFFLIEGISIILILDMTTLIFPFSPKGWCSLLSMEFISCKFCFFFIKLFIRFWEGCGWILELLNIKATVVLGYIFSYSAYQRTEKLVYHGNLNRLPKSYSEIKLPITDLCSKGKNIHSTLDLYQSFINCSTDKGCKSACVRT